MRSLRYCLIWLAALLLAPTLANADENWQSISQQARGQTVWFNAWGGDPAVNRYLDWVSTEVKRDYAVDLRIVHIADAADAIKRIQTEARAGRSRGGSIDLLWVNGENFRTLKQANLLRSDWAEKLPNWRYVDTRKPVREDFSIATDGAESPWGSAQLTLSPADRSCLPPWTAHRRYWLSPQRIQAASPIRGRRILPAPLFLSSC